MKTIITLSALAATIGLTMTASGAAAAPGNLAALAKAQPASEVTLVRGKSGGFGGFSGARSFAPVGGGSLGGLKSPGLGGPVGGFKPPSLGGPVGGFKPPIAGLKPPKAGGPVFNPPGFKPPVGGLPPIKPPGVKQPPGVKPPVGNPPVAQPHPPKGKGKHWVFAGVTILASDYAGCGYEYYMWKSTGTGYWYHRYAVCRGY